MGRSPLLSKFLLHVCEQHLRDNGPDLTEQRIGIQVFGRSHGYNSNDDNIVRNYARTLRKRIDAYFALEGRYEPLRLEIPRGGYVPVFTAVDSKTPFYQEHTETATPAAAPLVTESPVERNRQDDLLIEATPAIPADVFPAPQGKPLWLRAGAAAAAVLVAAAISLLAAHIWQREAFVAAKSIADQQANSLWSQLFQKDRDTFLVPADSGLVIQQWLTQQPVSLGDYASGNYRVSAGSSDGIPATRINELGARRYTSIVDLNLAARFLRLPGIEEERTMVRFARDLRIDDLRSGNAILFGSSDSDPWEDLFQRQLNFRFFFSPQKDASPVIVNQHPLPGEQPVYANRRLGRWDSTFGVIAYLPNLDGTGHVLLIAGLTMAGTQAAGNFVLNPALMKPTLDHARRPNGGLRPFEILIETDNVAANASQPHVLSERIGPA